MRVEDAKDTVVAKGALGDWPSRSRQAEMARGVVSRLGVLRGDVEDYRVIHRLANVFIGCSSRMGAVERRRHRDSGISGYTAAVDGIPHPRPVGGGPVLR